MQRRLVLCLILMMIGTGSIFAAKWEMYKVIDTIPIKRISKKRVFNEIEDWFKKERNTRLVRLNDEQFVIEGKSFFVYYNHVSAEDVFLSPRANERTTGNIVYQIKVQIFDSIVVAECSNFTHEAYYSQYGSISFATFTDYETVPPGRCMESKNWCNKVWIDLKSQSKTHSDDQILRMLPESMIRKKGKAFKSEKDNVIDTTPVKIMDPKDYLNIENYLIQDDTKKEKKSDDKTKKKKKKKKDDEETVVAPTPEAIPDSVADLIPEPTYESIKNGTPPPAPAPAPSASPAPTESENVPASEPAKPADDAIKND